MTNFVLDINGGGDSNYEISYDLDGQEYLMKMRYNDRAEAWSVSIFDDQGEPIISGARAVVNWNLLRLVADSRRPAGQFFILDTRSTPLAPTFLELGTETTAIYVEVGDG